MTVLRNALRASFLGLIGIMLSTTLIFADQSEPSISFVGQSRAVVESELQRLGIDYELNYIKVCVEKDVVISTNPSLIQRRSGAWPKLVIVSVSEREGRFSIPSLRGVDVSVAEEALANLGVSVRQVSIVPPKPAGGGVWIWKPQGAAGKVVKGVKPVEGSVVCLGAEVTLVVYKGGSWTKVRIPRWRYRGVF